MSISVQCPGCEKNLRIKDDLAGKRVKCPGCGHIMLVPSANESQPDDSSVDRSASLQVPCTAIPVKPSEDIAPCSKCMKRMPGRYFSFWVVEQYKVLVSVTTNTGYKDYDTRSRNAHEERSFLCFRCMEQHLRSVAYALAFFVFGGVAFCAGVVYCVHSDVPLSNFAMSLICAGSLPIGLLALGVTWYLAKVGLLKWDARAPSSFWDEDDIMLLAAEARRAEFEAFHRSRFGMNKSSTLSFHSREVFTSNSVGKDLIPPPGATQRR